MSRHSTTDSRSVASKVVAIICAFTHEAELSNVQIARLAGLPLSTAHRLVHELVAGGVLERTHQRLYRVGPSVIAIATGGASSADGRGGPTL